MNSRPSNSLIAIIEHVIFAGRWTLALLYLGLTFGMALYAVKFGQELWAMLSSIGGLTTETAMLALLGLVDISNGLLVGN